MKRGNTRSGVALLSTLVMMGVVTILLAGVMGYVSWTVRASAIATGRDICRLAAQSEIEIAKHAVNEAFILSLERYGHIIGGDAIGSTTVSSFDWFEAYSSTVAKRTIGAKNPLTLDDVVTTMDCVVKVRIGAVEHTVGTQWANVTFVARAERHVPGGPAVSSTVVEKVRFAQQRSKVFNNAYFVNNYGWFQGSGCTANGDVRANGNMSLDSNCKVNGKVYAAKNDELHVPGNITSTGQMDSYSTYRSTTYGSSNMARPLSSDPLSGELNAGGYEAPQTVTAADRANRIHANEDLAIEMPYIGDISSNESAYREWAQQLHDADPSMSTIKQNGKTLVSVYYDGVGPSGVEKITHNGQEITAPDYGAIVLEGTESHPIEINGPVIIPSDVIIKGYVTGQGTIYSGRNIHIVGNITYKNPPQWNGKSTEGASNATKDMLGLMAKGNIVLGDYTQQTTSGYGYYSSSSGWLSDIKTYLSQEPYVQKYKCDTSDAAIGYPETFGGNYTVAEYVNSADFAKCESAGLAAFVPGGRDSGTGKFGKQRMVDGPGAQKKATRSGTYETYNTTTHTKENRYVSKNEYYTPCIQVPGVSYDRKYYESVCLDTEISSRCSSTITRVDGVLYNNHGIFGVIGKCTFNGALVCRNEGIRYSSNLYLNWDIRLYSGSSETVDNDKVGLAKASDNPPTTVAWAEIPDGMVVFD